MQPTPPPSAPAAPGNPQVAAVAEAVEHFTTATTGSELPLTEVADEFERLHASLSSALATLEG